MQVLPDDVDYKVMLTFLEFYRTLLQFVNFKLYHMLGLRYPPLLAPHLEAAAADLEALMQSLGPAPAASSPHVTSLPAPSSSQPAAAPTSHPTQPTAAMPVHDSLPMQQPPASGTAAEAEESGDEDMDDEDEDMEDEDLDADTDDEDEMGSLDSGGIESSADEEGMDTPEPDASAAADIGAADDLQPQPRPSGECSHYFVQS